MHGPKRGHESDDDVYNKRVKKNTSTLTTINVAILDIINTVYDREKECTWDAEEVEVTLRLLETAHRTIGRGDLALADHGLEFGPLGTERPTPRDLVGGHEADVVAVALVSGARIAQAGDDDHGARSG